MANRPGNPSQTNGRPKLANCLAGILSGFFVFFLSPPIGRSTDTLTLSGSTMMAPLAKTWIRAYEKSHSSIHLEMKSDGSGAGIRNAGRGNVSIGVSDAYLTTNLRRKYPNLIAVPVAVGDAQILYNIPGLPPKEPLNIDGPTLADIFLGVLKYWDDPSLKTLNPGIDLPHLAIRPIHRSDPSGTTFVLTDYLSRTSRKWSDTVGRKKNPKGISGLGVSGSEEIVRAVRNIPGAVGYAGLSWADKARLPSMALENRDGFFVIPSPRTLQNAALSAFVRPDFPYGFDRSIVWNISGKEAYPDANFEYCLIDTNIDGQTMGSIRKFLLWILGPGQDPAYTVRNGFASLPYPRSQKVLSRIIGRLLEGNSFQEVSPG